MPVRAVVLDIGETVLDDTREWNAWADWIGVGRHTFSTVLGAVTAAGRDNAETFRCFRPDFDLAVERQLRERAGRGEQIDETDLYPDVRASLAELKRMGLRVALAGNQTAKAGDLLRKLDLPVDQIATSADWGVAKPDPRFFSHVVDMADVARDQLLYVGDHRDNDIIAGHAAGLRTALIRRGPWGHLWAEDPAVLAYADWVIDSLEELPGLVTGA
ncbi:HAD family hydrolase [Amycolatopsis sp. NPDC004747]